MCFSSNLRPWVKFIVLKLTISYCWGTQEWDHFSWLLLDFMFIYLLSSFQCCCDDKSFPWLYGSKEGSPASTKYRKLLAPCLWCSLCPFSTISHFFLKYHVCLFFLCSCLIVIPFRMSLCLVVDIVVASCLSQCMSLENDSLFGYLIVSFELKCRV